MDADEQFESYRRELIGRPISFVRLACGSLLLYVECKPGDGRGLTFWLNPPWHVSTPERLVAGSRQAIGAVDDGPTTEELDRFSGPICAALLDRPIGSIQIDERSRDLTVTVEGGNLIRTFVADSDNDHSWHLRDNSSGLRVCASPAGLEIRRGTT